MCPSTRVIQPGAHGTLGEGGGGRGCSLLGGAHACADGGQIVLSLGQPCLPLPHQLLQVLNFLPEALKAVFQLLLLCPVPQPHFPWLGKTCFKALRVSSVYKFSDLLVPPAAHGCSCKLVRHCISGGQRDAVRHDAFTVLSLIPPGSFRYSRDRAREQCHYS